MTDKADNDALVRDELAAMRKREVQLIGAGISMRNWHATEIGYNQLRDRIDGFILCLAALRTPQPAPVVDELKLEWREGEPSKPWRGEWFIAETTFADRVVLTALPEEYTYDYKTADDTYIKADKIKRWMQFPDSQYVAPSAEATRPQPDETETLRAEVARLRGLVEDVRAELRHASVFVRSREKMHPAGVALYDELLAKLETDHGRG